MALNERVAPEQVAGARFCVTAAEYLARRPEKNKEAFVAAHPEPVLIIEDAASLIKDAGTLKTNVVSYAEILARRAARQPRWLAAPVVKRTFDAFRGFIWIGREAQCDICLGYESVSKLQAQISQKRPGEYELSDAGSTNGTFVEDIRLEQGRLCPLDDGVRIRFGKVETIFFTAPSFWDFVHANQR